MPHLGLKSEEVRCLTSKENKDGVKGAVWPKVLQFTGPRKPRAPAACGKGCGIGVHRATFPLRVKCDERRVRPLSPLEDFNRTRELLPLCSR